MSVAKFSGDAWRSNSMATIDDVISILGEVLQLGNRTAMLQEQTPLLDNLPELDSMAVLTI